MRGGLAKLTNSLEHPDVVVADLLGYLETALHVVHHDY